MDEKRDSGKSEQNTEFVQYLSTDHERMVIWGYTKSTVRFVFAWTAIVLTAGLLYLVFHWKPKWKLVSTHVRCSLADATKLLILETHLGKYNSYCVKDVLVNNADSIANDTVKQFVIYLEDGSCKHVSSYRAFRTKKIYFIWDEEETRFQRLVGLENKTTCSKFHSIQGLTEDQQSTIRGVYGTNEIQVPVQTICTLIVLEFFNPFYMFQVFTIIVWLIDYYYYYSAAIIIMSIFGISTTVIQTQKNQKGLKSKAHAIGEVQVCRDKASARYETISSADLVPGDIFIIPSQGCTMHVDAVLLDGSCIVNESMLTGESVPITKTALPNQNRLYDIKGDSNHTLYCGTKVIQTRYYKDEPVRAVVLRTGFMTTKGQLVRSIMYPLPADFKFDRDSYKFIIILAVISLFGLLYTVLLKSGRSFSADEIIIKSLDIITIVIPPALPAVMTVGRLHAINRLKKANVFCIYPRVINVSGSTSCVCFDKTGTLTEDGLDMWGVIPVRKNGTNEGYYTSSSNNSTEDGSIEFGESIRDPSTLNDDVLIKVGMNVCHTLTILDDTVTGDPLDVKMFESTGWILEEPKVPDDTKFDLLMPTVVRSPLVNGSMTSQHEWGIIHQFQFSSSLQRCSVISKSLQSPDYMAFCKGSPEMIAALSRPETVPLNLKSTLRKYTQQGYRVLALSYKPLPNENFLQVQKLSREEIETELTFLGLIVLENRLKPESSGVIAELHEAHVKIVMITGDNLDTAVSVASECGLLVRGVKLVSCEAVQTNTDAPPELYYTSSLINIEGFKKSRTNSINVPSVARISAKDLNMSDIALNIPSSSTSSLSLNSIENAANKQYQIAMTGATWRVLRDYYPELIPKIITRGAVFARMSSDQKQQLVQELQALDYYVAMCGDGANDCGALKTAHVGISVSGEESSIASPFTSKEAHVGCVPMIIKEGRAALITSFGMFKFMVCYSLMEFFSVALLYYSDINLTDFQFLFIDIILILNFAFFFGRTHAYPGKICKRRPGTSLLGFVPLFSIFMQIFLSIIIQIASYMILMQFSWFVPHVPQGHLDYYSHENYSIYAVTMFHYISIVISFSHGKPFRKIIFTNYALMTSMVITTAICVYVAVYPAQWLQSLLELKLPPDFTFRYIVVALGFMFFLASLFIEKIVVQYMMQERQFLPKRLRENFPKSNSYHNIEKELISDTNWPPLVNKTAGTSTISNERVPNGNHSTKYANTTETDNAITE